jgi:acyl carrier protein
VSHAASRDPAAIVEEIRRYLLETFLKGGGENSITAATRLLGGDLLDSIGMLELTVHLEETYGVAIAAEEVTPENFGTLGSLARFVDRRVRGAAPP